MSGLSVRWVFPEHHRQACRIEQSHIVLGRADDCDHRLRGGSVSKRHAEICREGPIFTIRDLASTNGTYLNGQRICHSALACDDIIRLGEYVGVVVPAPLADESSAVTELAPGLYGGTRFAQCIEAASRASSSTIPILVVGETGTGKERVARAIHHYSGRRGPWAAINCAALPSALAEAELFGHRKGAFTGASQAGLGRFRAAHGGTLFLDEVADLPLATQAKLLRVLEEGTVVPLGGTVPVPIDVRVVAAGQRSLAELVQEGLFRQDLYARLAGLTVTLPALRERREDIAPLFGHFLAVYSGGHSPPTDSKLIECLCVYGWPQNVRELELLARQLLAVHGTEPVLKRSLLPDALTSRVLGDDAKGAQVSAQDRREQDLVRLAAALKSAGGNLSAAVASLGLSRQRAYRVLRGRSVADLLQADNPPDPADSGRGVRESE